MRSVGLDLLIVSSPENVFYLTDVPSSFTAANRLLFCSRRNSPMMCILPREGEPTLILSAAALDIARKHTWIKDLRLYATGTYILRKEPLRLCGNTFSEALCSVVKEKAIQGAKVGIERNDLNVSNYESIKSVSLNLVDGSEPIMQSRMIKNSEEVRRFKRANQILCKVFGKIESECKDRPTESELDFVLKTELMKNGAESWQQTTIAAGRVSGPDIYNQPVPNRRIREGDVIRMDVGCVYKGYTADLSRTFAVRKAPERAVKAYKVLRDAFTLYLDDLVPGTKASSINSRVVDYVRKNLDKNYYRGNVGHGVGVELYDRPLLGPDDFTPLEKNMTLSYEVPYHIHGMGGLNIEDSVLITEKGKSVVSKFDRDLIIV